MEIIGYLPLADAEPRVASNLAKKPLDGMLQLAAQHDDSLSPRHPHTFQKLRFGGASARQEIMFVCTVMFNIESAIRIHTRIPKYPQFAALPRTLWITIIRPARPSKATKYCGSPLPTSFFLGTPPYRCDAHHSSPRPARWAFLATRVATMTSHGRSWEPSLLLSWRWLHLHLGRL